MSRGCLSVIFVFCIWTIGCGEPASEAVPRLIVQFKSADIHERNLAAHKIGDYGKDAAEAVKPLIALLGDPNWGVRSSAAYSLRRIGTPEAIAALDTYEK